MNWVKNLRLLFSIAAANIFFFLSLLACTFYYNCDEGFLGLVFIIIIFSFLLINFLFIFLLIKNILKQKKIKQLDNRISCQLQDYQEKMVKIRNLAEAGKMSLGVFHDIANIVCASNLALEQALIISSNNEKTKKIIEKNLKINRKITLLLRNFKNYCREGSSDSDFFVIKEVKEILSIFRFCLIKNNVNIVFKFKKDYMIRGDRGKFYQIIINLLDNAIEAVKLNRVNKKIIISLSKSDIGIALGVTDNGSGISEKNIPLIFEPFFSLKNDKNEKNCGIGLSMVKSIVERDFNGKIIVRSILGGGTNFTIYFPYIKLQS